jgi:tetratricopeptide (TPR) repeat protein
MRLGQLEKAEEAYRNAIRCDEKNAFAWNNLSTLYFRQGDYAQALEYAKAAIAINAQMPQALGCAAVCSAMLGNEEEYRNFYRQAVSAGYDGNKIKSAIAALDPEAE